MESVGLLLLLPTLTVMFLVPSILMPRDRDRTLPRSIPNDLGTFVGGRPLFPMTVLQICIWLLMLLDPAATTLRSAQVVLQVLRVYILTLLKCRLLNRVPLLSGRRATTEHGLAE